MTDGSAMSRMLRILKGTVLVLVWTVLIVLSWAAFGMLILWVWLASGWFG